MVMKRLSSLFILYIFFSSVLASASDIISLAGEWRFAIDPANVGAAEGWWRNPDIITGKITLPGSMLTNGLGNDIDVRTPWTGSLYDSSYYHNPFMEPYRRAGQVKLPFFLTPGKHYVGMAWYVRSVNLPRSWRGRPVTLYLERPHIETTVYVNGHRVGHQMSLSAPHQYDISAFIKAGKENTIAIAVYNGIENVCVGQDSHSVTDQTQGNWNGLAGRIELRAEPLIWRRRVTTDLASGMVHIMVNEQTYDVHVPNAKPWNEQRPQLYTATVSYHGTPVKLTFGFRQASISGREIMLNGRPLHLRGTVENCCFPETGFPPTDTASWERIFSKCKEYGLNHMRFHSYCPPEAAFVAADRLGFYLQPEGPSWPNHGVKLGAGMPIDTFLVNECKRIIDIYGAHPSLVMLAAGNEPAGRWVEWGEAFVKEMRAYDPSRLYCTASVGGGWQWDKGSEYHVKGGARGLEWNQRRPSSDDDFSQQIANPRNYLAARDGEGTGPLISHEQGQWCAFPDFREIPQYTGAYKAKNFEIFHDLLAKNGMAEMAQRFLYASGRLQTLAYKYEIERHLRTPHYAGFQLLSLNDYSGQGTALVGVLNVHWREKGYCTAADWREFCSEVVPLARFPRFTFEQCDTITIGTQLYNPLAYPITTLHYTISLDDAVLQEGSVTPGSDITFMPSSVSQAAKLSLTITAADKGRNHWNFWVYPHDGREKAIGEQRQKNGEQRLKIKGKREKAEDEGVFITASVDSALEQLKGGRDVLLCAGGRIRYGADVVHRFLPVFWNTSWFKMKPPHTTGAYIQKNHPIFRLFPTDEWQDLQWWELTNRAQCINLAEFPASYMPIVQPIDTWHLSRRLAMLLEARVLSGRLILTTFDLTSDLDHRIVARQLRSSIISYMLSSDFQPELNLTADALRNLFVHDAPAVNMFTNDSPDELKPVIK